MRFWMFTIKCNFLSIPFFKFDLEPNKLYPNKQCHECYLSLRNETGRFSFESFGEFISIVFNVSFKSMEVVTSVAARQEETFTVRQKINICCKTRMNQLREKNKTVAVREE